MATRDVTVTVPDAEAYDTLVLIVPMPKGMIPGAENKVGLKTFLIGKVADGVNEFMQSTGLTWAGPNRDGKWV